MPILKIKRGEEANRTGYTPVLGELLWTTDGMELWIGDGNTAGGLLVNQNIYDALQAHKFGDLYDVVLSGQTDGDFVVYDVNSSTWKNVSPTTLTVNNANYLDNLDSTQFLRSDVDDTFTGSLLTIQNDFLVNGSTTIQGNLTVNGNTTSVNTDNVTTKDALIGLQEGYTGSNVNDLGFVMERGDSGDNVALVFAEDVDRWRFGFTTATADNTGAVSFTSIGMIEADLYGNSATTTKWATARTITLSGDVAGSVSIDGTSDVTVTTNITAGVSEMNDVDTSGVGDGDLLQFNSSSGNWEPTDTVDGGTF